MSKTSLKAERPVNTLFLEKIDAKLCNMKTNNDNQFYYCGKLIICPDLGLVKTPTEDIRLGPVNMRVLVTLIEKQGKIVSRTELFDTVWKNQVVNDDVLTRCISDLRALLAKHTEFYQWIETVPKRGYRWLPEVSQQKNSLRNQWQQYLLIFLVGVFSLLIISTSALWLLERWVRTDLIRIAVIPVKAEQIQQKLMASEVDDLLRIKLLDTKGLRILAQSAVESRPKNPFPYLSREFGIQWIIEGKVRAYQNKYRVSLSLVDPRSATVSYSLTQDIENNAVQLEAYCEQFISNISALDSQSTLQPE